MAQAYRHRFETTVAVDTTPEALFEDLDDHERLSAHMMKSSAMMAGSKMEIAFDAGGGRAVGSKIRMSGRMLGLRLDLEEVVTEREPPLRKTWETIGEPRLLVIGAYRMGFEIKPSGSGSMLKVFIDYDDAPGPWIVLSKVVGPVYARWCTVNMARGAAQSFAR